MNNELAILLKYLQRTGVKMSIFCKETDIPVDRAYQWKKGNGNPKGPDIEKITDWLRKKGVEVEKITENGLSEYNLQEYFSLSRESLLDVISELRKEVELLKKEVVLWAGIVELKDAQIKKLELITQKIHA